MGSEATAGTVSNVHVLRPQQLDLPTDTFCERFLIRERPLWERASELHGRRIPFSSAMWPEIAIMQRARLIRMAEWHDDLSVTLGFCEPPPVGGWHCMYSAPRNATWIIVRNELGEHRVHWAEDLSGEEQPAFRGWFVAWGSGFRELAGGEPTGWKLTNA